MSPSLGQNRRPGRDLTSRLPVELWLLIMHQLSFDGIYCLSQSSRSFKRLSSDWEFAAFQEKKSQLVTTHVLLRPWTPDLFGPGSSSRSLSEDAEIRHLLLLLHKDLFCTYCRKERQTWWFANKISCLQKPLRCDCGKLHPAIAFPHVQRQVGNRDKGHLAVGHTGRLRACSHKSFSAQDFRDGPISQCPQCPDLTFRKNLLFATGGYDGLQVVRRIPATQPPRHAASGLENQLEGVRQFCKTSREQYLCPHRSLGDDAFVARLQDAVRKLQSGGVPHGWQRLETAAGRRYNCRVCLTDWWVCYKVWWGHPLELMTVRYVLLPDLTWRDNWRSGGGSGCHNASWFAAIDHGHASAKDEVVNDAGNFAVTWCLWPECATNQQRRRLALLGRLFEHNKAVVDKSPLVTGSFLRP